MLATAFRAGSADDAAPPKAAQGWTSEGERLDGKAMGVCAAADDLRQTRQHLQCNKNSARRVQPDRRSGQARASRSCRLVRYRERHAGRDQEDAAPWDMHALGTADHEIALTANGRTKKMWRPAAGSCACCRHKRRDPRRCGRQPPKIVLRSKAEWPGLRRRRSGRSLRRPRAPSTVHSARRRRPPSAAGSQPTGAVRSHSPCGRGHRGRHSERLQPELVEGDAVGRRIVEQLRRDPRRLNQLHREPAVGPTRLTIGVKAEPQKSLSAVPSAPHWPTGRQSTRGCPAERAHSRRRRSPPARAAPRAHVPAGTASGTSASSSACRRLCTSA